MAPDHLLAQVHAIQDGPFEVEHIVHHALRTGGNDQSVYTLVCDVVLDELHAFGAAKVRMILAYGGLAFGCGHLAELFYVEGLPDAASRTNIYRNLFVHRVYLLTTDWMALSAAAVPS